MPPRYPDEARGIVHFVGFFQAVKESGEYQCCQMAEFDPFLALDCAGLEGVEAQSKKKKGSNFAA